MTWRLHMSLRKSMLKIWRRCKCCDSTATMLHDRIRSPTAKRFPPGSDADSVQRDLPAPIIKSAFVKKDCIDRFATFIHTICPRECSHLCSNLRKRWMNVATTTVDIHSGVSWYFLPAW
jgi:hypothetical protein